MKYTSTRGNTQPTNFSDAVIMGLASDGGLLLPEMIPDISQNLADLQNLSYSELALEIISLFATDIPREELKEMIDRSYSTFDHKEVAPSVKVGDLYILELFHGPTLAFKDLALQFLGNLFEYILKKRGGKLNILGATSGDTGSAAIEGIKGKENINIFIMHPYKRVSPVQEQQMTTVLDKNVYNIAIEGSFDDGQYIFKEIFGDLDFKNKYSLGAINSVNWARIVAQIVYYFYAAFRVCKETGKDKVQFCVPTGNFGDIFAGYIALKMNAPISRLILASNENDILCRFFNTGEYSRKGLKQTHSPSMDIEIASNFERYLYLHLNKDSSKINKLFEEFNKTKSICLPTKEKYGVDKDIISGSCNTQETLSTIKSVYEKHNYLLDPHTAVGFHTAKKISQIFKESDAPIICLATAHPAKFNNAITKALNKDIAKHPTIEALSNLPTRCKKMKASVQKVKEYIEKCVD
ncbi:MAG: threonine synthase [Verrucomicrobiota bacterium]|nr:threonine synthase [Verrucomicrobiota bacterium]